MSHIYMTRHGQSLTNTGLYPQFMDSPHAVLNIRSNVLTRQGIEEALTYGEFVADKNISRIIASPYSRAKQTAFTIASVLQTMVDIDYDDGFHELEWDIERILTPEEIAQYEQQDHLHATDRILHSDKTQVASIETQHNVYDRVIPVMRRYAEMARDEQKNILIVSHFFPVRAVWAHLNHRNHEAMVEFTPSNLCRLNFAAEDFLNP